MSGAVLAPPDADPSTCPPTPDGALPAHLARDLVTRLARAIQRATIYPPGHPSIRSATMPLVEALHGIDAPHVLIGFTSERVFVGLDPRDAQPFDLPWLSARLNARGLSSLRIEPRIAPDEAGRLLEWLAGDEDLLSAQELPIFDGAVVTRVDFAAVRFREKAAESASSDSPSDLAWTVLSRELAGDWVDGPRIGLRLDPVELARLVREAIERHEGTGISELGTRLGLAGTRLAALPEDVQGALKSRLVAFVAALPVDLRTQLLSVAPDDDPARLELLAGLVDRLPSALVLEVIQGARLSAGGSSRQFLSFMVKLASVAATEPVLADAFEQTCASAGLPRDLVYLGGAHLARVLGDLLEARAGAVAGIAPDDYQRQLDEIGTSSRPGHRGYDCARHVAPDDEVMVARQNARIALQLLRTTGMDPADQAICLDRLSRELPAWTGGWQADVLAQVAELAVALGDPGTSPPPVLEKATALAAWFEQPAMVDAVLARLDAVTDEPSPDLLLVARAGGRVLAGALLASVAQSAVIAERQRRARTLGWLDGDVVRQVVAEAYRRAPRQARTLLSALAAGGSAAALIDIAALFLEDADPMLRHEAFRLLLEAPIGATRVEALLRRGLEDPEPRIVHLAIDEAARRPRAGARPLAAFLGARLPESATAAQLRAVRTLAAMGDGEARHALCTALEVRQHRFDPASRATALAIAQALDVSGDVRGRAAVKAWRRSPGGLLARLLGGGRAA